MHLAEDLILKKRDGKALSAAEIGAFVRGITSGEVTDAQIAAFTMATWFRNMNREERQALTLAMRDSGEVMEWPELDGPVLDKHSTGGVGDLVSLILGPIVASCGAYIPMISGHGLGHTGGTLDKLESIPGFDSRPDPDRFRRIVREHRLAIIGQTDRLAPADRRVYAVRDVTATVASTPLIISSILSKKLAEGLDGLVMDIKCGSGAFSADPAEAAGLARDIATVAHAAGLPCTALVTDMDQPLAWSAGNALEVLEAIRFLRGDERRERLLAVVLALSAEMLLLGGLADDAGEAERMAERALDSGRAAERFARMVAAQGGPPGLLEDADALLPRAPLKVPVAASRDGFVSAIETKLIGSVVIRLGGGRQRAGDGIDPAVGLSGIVGVGEKIAAGAPLAWVHAGGEERARAALDLLQTAFRIADEPPESRPVVFDRIEGESQNE